MADTGSIVDATITDAGRPCNSGSCVNFDDGKWPDGWSVNGDGDALTVTPGPTTSGGFALDVVFRDQLAFLSVDVAGASKVTVTANVLVLQFGSGETDFLGIAEEATTGASGLFLVHPRLSGERLAVELPKNEAQLALESPFTTYTPVRLELDLAAKTYAYTVGSETKNGPVTSPPSSGKLAVVIGGNFVESGSNPWHLRYDDIEIVTTK